MTLGHGWFLDGIFAALAVVWLSAMWRSLKRIGPITVDGKDLLGFNRRTCYLLITIVGMSVPVYTILDGNVTIQLTLWPNTIIVFLGIFYYWYLSDYTRESFYSEMQLNDFQLQKSKTYPDAAISPSWLFNSPWLTVFGVATILAGMALGVRYLDLKFLALSGYGLLYLVVLCMCNGWLDMIKIWHDRVEFSNGFDAARSSIVIPFFRHRVG